MKLELNTIEIRILLKCYAGLLNRTVLSQLFQSCNKQDRDKAVESLLKSEFINALELPKPGAKKIPVFYEITPKGKKWVMDYLENYPD